MTADQLLESLAADGVDLQLCSKGKLTAPAGRLTDAQRSAIKERKAEIVEALIRRNETPSASLEDLLAVAMRVCDIKRDNAAQREDMRRDLTEFPPNQRLELINYFRSAYPDLSEHKQGQQ